jgi:hypothetical protein
VNDAVATSRPASLRPHRTDPDDLPRLARKVELEVHRDGWRQVRRLFQVRWGVGGPTIEPADDRSDHASIPRLCGLGGYLCPPSVDALVYVGEAWCAPGLDPEEMDERFDIPMPDDLRRGLVLVRRSVVASRSGAQAVIIRPRNRRVLELDPENVDLPSLVGLLPDLLRRCLGQPSEPVDFPPSSFVVRTWLNDVHLAAIRRGFGDRRLSFDDIQRQPVQLPGKRAGDFRGPAGLAAVARRYPDRKLHIGAITGWFDVLPPAVAEWMDSNLFVLWLVGELADPATTLSILPHYLDQDVYEQLVAALDEQDLLDDATWMALTGGHAPPAAPSTTLDAAAEASTGPDLVHPQVEAGGPVDLKPTEHSFAGPQPYPSAGEAAEVAALRAEVAAGTAEIEHLRSANQEQHLKIEALQKHLAAVQANFKEVARANGAVLSSHLAAPTNAATVGPFLSLLEASLRGRDDCSDILVFLPEALKSAEESPYRHPDRAFEALQAIAAAGRAWRDGELPRGGFGAFFTARAQDYASGSSQTTRQKWQREYERSYQGRKVLLGPHLRLGVGSPETCLRIYWYLDKEQRRIVVGHIGRHLTTAKT